VPFWNRDQLLISLKQGKWERMNSSSEIALVAGMNHVSAIFDGIMPARNS